MGLAGQLPLDPTIWGALPALSVLDLHNNTMNGYLPPQVTRPGHSSRAEGCAPFLVANVLCVCFAIMENADLVIPEWFVVAYVR